jgi:hypothetical protein
MRDSEDRRQQAPSAADRRPAENNAWLATSSLVPVAHKRLTVEHHGRPAVALAFEFASPPSPHPPRQQPSPGRVCAFDRNTPTFAARRTRRGEGVLS